jgi:CRP/FNR family cyclic AMP-dependent transcriptional regulator
MGEAEFLHTLTPAETDALEDLGAPAAFAAGDVIFAQGDAADRVLLVRAGRVRVTARGPAGAEVALAERGAGELLGHISGIDGGPRSASVTALDEVRGLVVPLGAFRAFLLEHPRVALSLLELLSRRLRESEAHRLAEP